MDQPANHIAEDPLLTPLQYVKGVGPKRAELLAKLDLQTVFDLLWHAPRDYLDLTDLRVITALEPDKVQTVRGRVVDCDSRQLSRGRTMTVTLLECTGGYLRGLWFNQPWMFSKMRVAGQVLFSGKPKLSQGRWEMSHPRVQFLDSEEDVADNLLVLPRYGLTEGLKMHEMRRIASEAVEEYRRYVLDPVPVPVREKRSLPVLADALRRMHLPQSLEEAETGRRCLVYHDLLDLQLALAMRRRAVGAGKRAPVLPTTPKIDARIRRLFPFDLTAGQNRAIGEIVADLAREHPMQRLLQADVGAGKTAVALYAMLVAVAAGYQTCMMAPTELLTQQHWQTVERLLGQSRVERLLLTGQRSPKERQQALDRIRSGEVQLVVGTQALIQADVVFPKLGLVVVDEQHRFGVQQRAQLTAGNDAAHLLVMTATPIPRSLCLTQFGDLDLSVIRELPPGRMKVVTHRVDTDERRGKAWEFVRKKLATGRQVYIVCPRVEQSDPEDSSGAESTFQALRMGELRDFQVGLVHGRQDRDLKQATMQAFRDGKLQALVSTTVIEVGVDVPNANLMLILDAERFGLSQLHQLRGRVGRGEFQGYCFLFSRTDKEDALQRLQAMEKTADGFEIAEEDFRLRGPGDVLGTRQHGELPLRIADLTRDAEVLELAREDAQMLVSSQQLDQPEALPLKLRVLDRFGKTFDLGRSG